jgi:hypothetical protein
MSMAAILSLIKGSLKLRAVFMMYGINLPKEIRQPSILLIK